MEINGSSDQRHPIIGYVLVLLGALGFSAKAIIIKLAYVANVEVDAITLMALRMLFALPFFLFVAIWHNIKSPALPLDKKHWGVVIVPGLMGYYIASYLDFLGLQFISAGLERIVIFLYPTFVVLFSAIVYKRRITARVGIALCLSYAGIFHECRHTQYRCRTSVHYQHDWPDSTPDFGMCNSG